MFRRTSMLEILKDLIGSIVLFGLIVVITMLPGGA